MSGYRSYEVPPELEEPLPERRAVAEAVEAREPRAGGGRFELAVSIVALLASVVALIVAAS